MLFLVLILTIFLFVGGESQQAHRLIKDTWDAGHLLLFGLLSFLYFSHSSQRARSVIYKVIFTSIGCLVLGTAIEAIQLFTHREFSYDDIINDLLGGYLGLLSLLIFDSKQNIKRRTLASIFFILGLTLGLRNLEMHLLDEYQIRQQFPLLAGFETELELARWEQHLVNIKRTKDHATTGDYALQATYLPGRYANITLQHMKQNWSGFSSLTFTAYNPQQKNLNFELKLYDLSHTRQGRKYSDRFNRSVIFTPGWNTIDITLADIITAPRHRRMNIQQMQGFSLFTDKLPEPVTLYLDDIRLH